MTCKKDPIWPLDHVGQVDCECSYLSACAQPHCSCWVLIGTCFRRQRAHFRAELDESSELLCGCFCSCVGSWCVGPVWQVLPCEVAIARGLRSRLPEAWRLLCALDVLRDHMLLSNLLWLIICIRCCTEPSGEHLPDTALAAPSLRDAAIQHVACKWDTGQPATVNVVNVLQAVGSVHAAHLSQRRSTWTTDNVGNRLSKLAGLWTRLRAYIFAAV